MQWTSRWCRHRARSDMARTAASQTKHLPSDSEWCKLVTLFVRVERVKVNELYTVLLQCLIYYACTTGCKRTHTFWLHIKLFRDTAGASSWMTSPNRSIMDTRAFMHDRLNMSSEQRYSNMTKLEIESPSHKGSRRSSMVSIRSRKETPQIEVLSTAVHKSPFKRPDSSRISTYGEGQFLATASNFF